MKTSMVVSHNQQYWRPEEKKMDGSVNFKEAWDFPVETYNLWAVSELSNQPDIEVPQNMSRAIVRPDTGQVLGIHGSTYEIVKHDTVVNSIVDAVNDAELSKDIEVKVDVIDGGKKMQGSILFNDLVVEPDVGDYVKFQVLFYNSYDGSWSFQQAARGFRLWCKNGCADIDSIANTVSKHTKGISVAASAAKIKAGAETFFKKKDLWQAWMKVAVTDQMAESFFLNSLCLRKNATSTDEYNKKRLKDLMGLWHSDKAKLGANKWALYNAMTYWASHTEANKSPENTSKDRNALISKLVNRPNWMNEKPIPITQ
jgi:hypothetical protein